MGAREGSKGVRSRRGRVWIGPEWGVVDARLVIAGRDELRERSPGHWHDHVDRRGRVQTMYRAQHGLEVWRYG